MPPPPSSMRARTVASVTFLPLFSLSRLNRPLSPGPILVSVESALWHTAQAANTVFPLAASPFAAPASAHGTAATHRQTLMIASGIITDILPAWRAGVRSQKQVASLRPDNGPRLFSGQGFHRALTVDDVVHGPFERRHLLDQPL